METIYVDPENYGIDSGKLREMLEVLEKEAELHSISVKYEGKTNFGEFILVQNDNSTLKSLAFKNSDFKIVFK